jgi:hypothetical protein
MVHFSPEMAKIMGGVSKQNSSAMFSSNPLGKYKKAKKIFF